MKRLTILFCVVFILSAGCATAPNYREMAKDSGGSAISYTQNTSPSRTDEALGIDDPSGSWSINRFPYSDILGLIIDGDIPSTIMRDSEAGTAASRDAGDTMTPGTNDSELPDVGAIKAWLDSYEKIGDFDLSNGDTKWINQWYFYSGEAIDNGVQVYIKYDSGDSRTELYEYTGDYTDADNDTYIIIGFAQADCSAGTACLVNLDTRVYRRDEHSITSTEIGKPYFVSGGAGYQSPTVQTESGDHTEIVCIAIGGDGVTGWVGGSGGSNTSVTGDYLICHVPGYMSVVP